MSGRYVSIFAGKATQDLGARIAEAYGRQEQNPDFKLGKSSVVVFSDGEFQPSYDESIRGHHVYIVQSTMSPTHNLMELLLMIDAAKRASAHKIIAVIPYFGWARQDRKDQPRVSIGSKLVANLLTAAGLETRFGLRQAFGLRFGHLSQASSSRQCGRFNDPHRRCEG